MPEGLVPSPSMASPRRMTVSVAAAFTMMPFVPETSTPAILRPSMVIDLVMVTAPYPPGSSTLITPAAAVFEIAPAKVLQGAVRLHGFTSSPTPETHVRVAWAEADFANKKNTSAASTPTNERRRMMILPGTRSLRTARGGRERRTLRGRGLGTKGRSAAEDELERGACRGRRR